MRNRKTEYRNAIRSKTLLRNAFLELMKQNNDILKIKTKDIFELAGVSKGTFYSHYKSTYDIFLEIQNEYLLKMFIPFNNRKTPITFEDLLPLFMSGLQEIEKDREIYSILFSTNYGESFINKVKYTFVDYMMRNYTQNAPFDNPNKAQGFFIFIAGGALTIISEWMEKTPEIPSQKVAQFLNECITIKNTIVIKQQEV